MLGIAPDDAGAEAGPSDASASAEAAADAATEAGLCNLQAPFGASTVIVESSTAHANVTLSDDELTILVDTLVAAPLQRLAIFVATRQRVVDSFPAGTEITGPVADPVSNNYNGASHQSADFGTAAVVGELNSDGNERPAWISPDSCRLYFNSDQSGRDQIFVASRPRN